MHQSVSFVSWPRSKSVASVELFIRRLSENFGVVRIPNGAEAILGELKKCYAAMPEKFPRISTKSAELLVRLTICVLQTQTTLDGDLRQIICTGAKTIASKGLAKELAKETTHQNLAQNSQWIHILKQQNLQNLEHNADGQSFEKIMPRLKNALKLVKLAKEAAVAFHDVALTVPYLFKDEKRAKALLIADSLLNTAPSPQAFVQKNTASLALDIPSPSNREAAMVPACLAIVCKFCQKAFSRERQLFGHMRIHTGQGLYKCSVYPKTFTSKEHQSHTGAKSFVCSVCQKGFSQSSNLKKHSRTHTGEKPYTCNICQKSFLHKCNLKDHMRIHTGDRPYRCNVCSKSFGQSGHLVTHIRIHIGEKPYTCKFCKKSFSRNSTLKVHTRGHTGEKPFVCSVCVKGFARSDDLKIHSRTHTGEQPYTCDFCNKSFSQKRNLYIHNKRIHTRGNLPNCNKISDLQDYPPERCVQNNGVQITPLSPTISAEFVCKLPEQQTAMDLSKPRSVPASSLDSIQEERCVMGEVTPRKRTHIHLSTTLHERFEQIMDTHKDNLFSLDKVP